MKFKELSEYLEKLEKTSSRLAITDILSELFDKSSTAEIDKVIYLSLGYLAPSFKSIVFNLAERMMLQVVADAYSKDAADVKSLYKAKGDLGDVARSLGSTSKKAKTFSVTEVYDRLVKIAKDEGEGSQERKIKETAKLLSELDPLSAKYVVRIPIGKLRLGFSEKTIIDALSHKDKQKKKEIEAAYNIRPDIGYIATLVKEEKLEKATPEIGVPVVPMLAQRLNSPADMIKKMGTVSVEPKFDGLRIFIHYRKKDNFIATFTRNMNAIANDTFPELSEVGKYIKADEVILDTEAVGIDPEREMFLDFQKTMSRRRKHDVAKHQGEIPLQFQVFDLLFVNGKSLLDLPYLERRKKVEEVVVDGKLLRVDENTVTEDPGLITKLHQRYLKMGLEGIIAKRADSKYVSGRTGWNWVKMKEAEGQAGKLADTIDCVIMGYTQGKGKRSGFGVGQFLAGIAKGDKFLTITKVGTGLTDEQFKELNIRLSKIKTTQKPKEYEVAKVLGPDFWVTPEIIVELAADEITKSPNHTSGYALRFPRLVKFRDDKSKNQTTTIQEIKKLASLQKS